MSGSSHKGKRFLMAVAVAAVVGAVYVATATGSGLRSASTGSQLAALKKEVATLSKKVKAAQNNIDAVAFAWAHCSLHSKIGIDQRGGAGFGYSYSPDGVNSSFSTALDLDTSGTPTYVVTPFNSSDPACNSLIGAALRHDAASTLAQRFGQRP